MFFGWNRMTLHHGAVGNADFIKSVVVDIPNGHSTLPGNGATESGWRRGTHIVSRSVQPSMSKVGLNQISILKAAQVHTKLKVLNMDNIGGSNEIGKHIAATIGSSRTLQEIHIRQNNIKASGDLIADVLRKNLTVVLMDALFNDFSYKAFSAADAYIARNRKTWNHNAVPRLSAEIADLNSSEKELSRVQEEMEAERRSMKDKMDEGYRRKETAKNHLELLRKQNVEWESQLDELKEITADLEKKYNDLAEVVQREKSKMDGKQNVTESKRKMEEDKKLEFNKQRDRQEKKLKEFMEVEIEVFKVPKEELAKWEGERDRERNDARTQAEHLVAAEIRLLELQITLGMASLIPPPEAQPEAENPVPQRRQSSAGEKAQPPAAAAAPKAAPAKAPPAKAPPAKTPAKGPGK
jgi:hypothetical protein